MSTDRVLIAGAGPVGLVAAAQLVARDVPVTILEAGPALSRESRASTFQPATLDMLDAFGVEDELERCGLRARYVQYRNSGGSIIARFDFNDIADLVRHPYRLQSEQWQLTRILLDKLRGSPNFEIAFDSPVTHAEQDEDSVRITVGHGNSERKLTGRWLIGADGAHSAVRHAMGTQMEGFTWPERFLVLATSFDFLSVAPDADSVSYVADPVQWYFLLRIPGVWRVMFPVPGEMSDDAALSDEYAQACLHRVAPHAQAFEIVHKTLYAVHQRVAKTFRQGRMLLAGDAAHINNPLGGLGMNGGIHDALNLTTRLAAVWHGESDASDLDLYVRQRRGITMEIIQGQSIRNKRNLEAKGDADRAAFRVELHETASDKEKTRAYLKRLSMLSSLERAAEIP